MNGTRGWDIAIAPAHTARPPMPERRVPSIAPHASEPLLRVWHEVFASSDRCRCCLVTSALSGEGVTQVAAGLALAGSRTAGSSRIALVDFNLQRPVVTDLFGLPGSPGLLHVLDGRATLAEALVQVSLPGLDVLPAGCPDGSQRPSLTSGSAASLLGELKRGYDYLIIDSPAIARTDTFSSLCPLVDGVLLVVKAASTRRDAVIEAKLRIERSGGRIVGVVLNQ